MRDPETKGALKRAGKLVELIKQIGLLIHRLVYSIGRMTTFMLSRLVG